MMTDIPELFQGALGRYAAGMRTSNTTIDDSNSFAFDEPAGRSGSSTKNWSRLSRPIEKDLGGPSNTELLTWLWKSCVRPVIRKLQDLDISPDTAGNLEPDQHEAFWNSASTCLDWMKPSYAPTIRALKYARARAKMAQLDERPAVLVVIMPSTPGQSDLTGVLREKAAVQAAAANFQVNSLPDYPAADAVLASLPGS
ncbi:hypothetical protein IWZ03DRAFT_55774 [Phyllosticta citriasiana]|uniref:Uncharacterized protein n=1 Tax=Phyllosticta citriasiana TaxID=595635 RepID=A0ABR1KCV9_9PEZI